MRIPLRPRPTVLLFGLLLSLRPPAHATVQVVLVTDQTPGDAGLLRVQEVLGGVWDRSGNVLLSGRYQPETPGGIDRNAIWTWTGPNSARELYSDGDAVPYYSIPGAGTVIGMSVPIIQPRSGGYRPPPGYWCFLSAVTSRPPEIPEMQACWVDAPGHRPAELMTEFVVNDLETHLDGTVLFTRPTIAGAVVRPRASTDGLDGQLAFFKPGGGAVQYYVNGSYAEGISGRGGSVIWIVRSDFAAVASERKGVVRMIAASSGMALPNLPGGRWSSLRVLGVTPDEALLWEAGVPGGTSILRGDAGSWEALLEPGMPSPPVRFAPPSPATPVASVGTAALVDQGSGVLAAVRYDLAAGDMAGRTALVLHDGSQPRLLAFEQETVDGSAAGTRLEPVSLLNNFDSPGLDQVAFFNPVRGGTQPFPTVALLLAGEANVHLLARQGDPLPVPADVDRIVQFRFPVLSARNDRSVAFAAEVEYLDGSRQEVLYNAQPGLPNRYEVLLRSGETFSFDTRDGRREATIHQFTSAEWSPGTRRDLLVGVTLTSGGSAVLLLVGDAEEPPRLSATAIDGGLRLRWPLADPRTVESTHSLDSAEWIRVELVPDIIDGDTREIRVPIDPVSSRFFRLH